MTFFKTILILISERQFISDALHELRTPLSVIKGNLEVLIRRQREPHEYHKSVKYCINEVDRISFLVHQLLMIAKYENNLIKPRFDEVVIEEMIPNVLKRVSVLINDNNTAVISDIKTANIVNGASAKYAAYSKKAKEEGFLKIAKLFEATSNSEKIHANNHIAVLEKLGVKAEEVQPKFEVKSTKENLNDAIAGESYEMTTMYPGFIKTSDDGKVNLA